MHAQYRHCRANHPPQLAPTYRTKLSDEDIERLTIFFRSDTGQRYRMNKTPPQAHEISDKELREAHDFMTQMASKLTSLQGPYMDQAVAQAGALQAQQAQQACAILLQLVGP